MPPSTRTSSPASWSSCPATGKDQWLAARLRDLGYADIDGICRAARACRLEGIKKDELNTALGYFENNAPRMPCHWFGSRGLFTGSGAGRSRLQSGTGQRLKQSGMHWTVAGASHQRRAARARAQKTSACVPAPDSSRLTAETPELIMLTSNLRE